MKASTTTFDPMVEDTYWRDNYASRPYADQNVPYSEYSPAYRYGWESYQRHHGRKFDDVETDLERGWDKVKGQSKLTWMKAKNAVRDAWHRIERALPGDADNDGR
jgi:hypothetical protein